MARKRKKNNHLPRKKAAELVDRHKIIDIPFYAMFPPAVLKKPILTEEKIDEYFKFADGREGGSSEISHKLKVHAELYRLGKVGEIQQQLPLFDDTEPGNESDHRDPRLEDIKIVGEGADAKIVMGDYLQKMMDEAMRESGQNIEPEAPAKEYVSFDFLLYLAAFTCTREQREGTLGDIEEKFGRHCLRFGKTRAKKIVAWDIFLSILPFLRDFTRTRTVKVLKSVGLYQVLKFFFG